MNLTLFMQVLPKAGLGWLGVFAVTIIIVAAVELLERLDAYGTKMLPQVSMGYGRNALGCFCPSEIPYYHDPARKAPALTREQIQQKIDQMIATAVLLRQCGFPGIEVHAMHWGYLLDQFALSFMNHRTDEYGGALENRLRCAREIVEGVKAACGADFVVSMRLALKSYIKGYNKPSLHGEEEVGRTLEEGLEIARRLEAYGYDCLSVDFGQYDSFYYAAPPCYMEKGRVIPLAAAVKQVVKIPILCGGRMNDPDLAAQAIAQGKLDAVVLGRPSLADPAYPQKVATGRPEDIRPCIGCNQGCIGALKVGRRAGCAVNPQAAREASFALTPAPRKKSVLVVGGGVAGMEAARCAALRGHDVTLCEGSDRLGGNLIPAGAHPFKEELNELNRWYQGQLAQLGVTVELGVRLTAREIQDRSPDAVVLAVGAGATGGLKTVAQAFAGVFGPTADTQVMDQIGYPIGASDTDNGVTVTAEAILFDGYNYLMTYSIAREDGTAFSVEEIPQGEGRLNLTWDSADSTIGRNTTGAHGSSYFYDADPTDAAIQYVETMSYHEQAQAGGTVKITLQDLRTVGDRETASQVLAEGTWNLKFQLKAGDLSVRLPVGQTLEWNGMTATIDALVVSPIGYYLRYTVDQQAEPVASGTGQMTQAQEEQWARFDLPHGLKRTDGTVLSLSDGTGSTGGSMAPQDGKEVCTRGGTFAQTIPVEEIAAFVVGGVEIPMP